MSQSIKRRIYNRAAVAAEANDRLNKYKRINADTKKKTKGIQIKPLQIEDDTKLTKDGVNEVSGFHPHFGCRTPQYQRLHPLHAPPDAPGRADFEHKFNSDSNEAMIWRSVASIIDKRYKATIASMADQSKAMIASMNHTMNHNTAMMTKTMNSLKRDLDLLQLKHDAQTHRLAEVTSLCVQLKKAIPLQIKSKDDDDNDDDDIHEDDDDNADAPRDEDYDADDDDDAHGDNEDDDYDFVAMKGILDTNGDSMPDDGKTYILVVTKMKRRKIIRSCWTLDHEINYESRSKKSTMRSNRTSNNHSPADTGNIGKIVNCTSCGESRDPQSEDICLKNVISDQHCPVKSKYFDKFPVVGGRHPDSGEKKINVLRSKLKKTSSMPIFGGNNIKCKSHSHNEKSRIDTYSNCAKHNNRKSYSCAATKIKSRVDTYSNCAKNNDRKSYFIPDPDWSSYTMKQEQKKAGQLNQQPIDMKLK